jgi:hypothetical protein
MQNHNSYEYGSREFHRSREENGVIVLTILIIAAIAIALYILVARFHIQVRQLLELGLYLIAILGTLVSFAWYVLRRNKRIDEAWPHPPVFIPQLKDKAHVGKAFRTDSIIPGYDNHGKPWYWSHDSRRMQALVLGMSGSGKSTLLSNIGSQDVFRKVNGEHLPLIIFDCKGDRNFLKDLLEDINQAGRMQQLRLIDPFHPDISARFNPLYNPNASAQELITNFFESFVLEKDFFRSHQAAYLGDIGRVLYSTGKIFNIPDIIVTARDPLVMKEQIARARYRLENESQASIEQFQSFELSAGNLLQSLDDRERVSKIQGLLNELMTFTEDDLSLITNAYDDLLTLDDVIDQKLILFVSLNTNKNPRAVTALGRMLLQSLQLMVANRYLSGQTNTTPVSVILDEFAPFAYPGFSQILQTARGSNISLLFSLQSIPQLESVSRGFAEDVSSAPNTTMLLRTRDEATVQYFLNASARVIGERKTMTVERKGVFSNRYQEIGFGSVTETEKTRAIDFEIKNLPVGQMQVLTSDHRLGTLHMHLHVRRASRYVLRGLEPMIYPRPRQLDSRTNGANLRFKTAGLARMMGKFYEKNGAI